MAFTASAMFVNWPLAMIAKTRPTSYSSIVSADASPDTIRAALYNNTGTPDKTAAHGYNTAASPWVVANELTDATNWIAKGKQLSSVTSAVASNVYTMDAADAASGGNVTIAGIMGCLVYDDTITGAPVADMGICYNYFGGSQSVSGGTFTIVWNSAGIAQITV